MGVKNVDIGKMRTPVKFERNAPTDADSGGEFDHFTEFLTTRGYLKKLKGQRGLDAGMVLLKSDYRLVVRFQSAIENELNSSVTCRIVADNRFFTIDSYAVDIEDRVSYYVFDISEQRP